MSFWFPAVVELKSFGISFVVVGQQYSLSFILVSNLNFEMFGILANILPLAVFFLLDFFQSLYILLSAQLAVFKFGFSNKIITLNFSRDFLIKAGVFWRS